MFEDKLLGGQGGDSLSGEFFSLPKSLGTIEPYDHIWDLEAAYHREIIPGREELLTNAIEESEGVEYIVSYGRAATNRTPNVLLNHYPSEEVKTLVSCDHSISYTLYRLSVDGSPIHLIHSPFFGMGRTSYSDVAQAAKGLREVTDSVG